MVYRGVVGFSRSWATFWPVSEDRKVTLDRPRTLSDRWTHQTAKEVKTSRRIGPSPNSLVGRSCRPEPLFDFELAIPCTSRSILSESRGQCCAVARALAPLSCPDRWTGRCRGPDEGGFPFLFSRIEMAALPHFLKVPSIPQRHSLGNQASRTLIYIYINGGVRQP